MIRALLTILKFDIRQLWRDKIRIASSLVRPLMWLFIIGNGFERIVQPIETYRYQQFMVPGLVGMVLLFGAILASLTMAQERDAPVMRMLIIAPFAHHWIIVIRVVSSAIAAIQQALLLIVVVYILGLVPENCSLPLLLTSITISAFTFASIGINIAIRSRNLENFTAIMNFVIFPLFFLSGALYPVKNAPMLMKLVMLMNPFLYSVDLLQHSFAISKASEFTATTDFVCLLGFSAVLTGIAMQRFLNRPLLFAKKAK